MEKEKPIELVRWASRAEVNRPGRREEVAITITRESVITAN